MDALDELLQHKVDDLWDDATTSEKGPPEWFREEVRAIAEEVARRCAKMCDDYAAASDWNHGNADFELVARAIRSTYCKETP